MRILWLATKLPWPPVDGGRLVARLTIEALAGRGHRLTVVAPAVDRAVIERSKTELERLGGRLETVEIQPRPRWLDALATPLSRRPWTIRRHASTAYRSCVERLARSGEFDLVHAEQVQTAPAALASGLPWVLRAQNVESDLWFSLARRRPLLGPAIRLEAGRLAAFEAEQVHLSSCTVALTREDAARLRQLADSKTAGGPIDDTKVVALEAPFPSELAASPRRLDGDPPLVLFGSPGWWPNRDGVRYFLDQVWPHMRERHPRCVLHVFGFVGPGSGSAGAGRRLQLHPPPAESADALPPGAILLVPLFVSSGVRMKILEAWARGIPVIASAAAARGLAASSGRELMIAEQPSAWSEAVAEIEGDRAAFVASGRSALARHAPERIARELERIYRDSLESGF